MSRVEARVEVGDGVKVGDGVGDGVAQVLPSQRPGSCRWRLLVLWAQWPGQKARQKAAASASGHQPLQRKGLSSGGAAAT